MSHYTDPFENYPSRTKPSSTFQTDQITNAQATSESSYYEIDDRTGFKKYPSWHPLSKVVEDGYGWRTDQPDDRHPQDFVKARGNDEVSGPQNPEPDVVYLSSTVSPEDL